MTNKEKILQAFQEVKNLGWIRSHRAHNTGIGKTFEDCIGVVENNLNQPDLFGFEIKAHRNESSSFVTLFTKSPSYPKRGANRILKDKYGSTYPQSNVTNLHTSIYADRYNTYKNKYSFKLIDDPKGERIFIGVYSIEGKNEIDRTVYYTYKDIKDALKKKLNNLLYVGAQRKFENNVESFYFDKGDIYMEPSFTRFLQLLKAGDIRYDIRMGAYQSGKNIGKAHDHGSGFRIKEDKLRELYSFHEKI